MNKVLTGLNEILTDRKIASELSEDKEMLSILLAKETVGLDVYGYVFFVPFADEKKEAGGYWIVRWDVLDVSDISDANWQKLCAAVAMINPTLPVGGYGLSGYTPQTQTEDDMKTLVYQITIPLSDEVKDTWLKNEIMAAIEASAAVLKKTVDPMYLVAAGKKSIKDFVNEFM